jgi:membrane protease YdiL (CAAX protease family)
MTEIRTAAPPSATQTVAARQAMLLTLGATVLMASMLAREAQVHLSATQLLIAKLLIVAPLVEELFFRGVVHAELRRRSGLLGGPIAAIVVTALAFGAAHLAVAPTMHASAVVLPALAIGWVYERSRSIATCVALHAAFNALWLWWELT